MRRGLLAACLLIVAGAMVPQPALAATPSPSPSVSAAPTPTPTPTPSSPVPASPSSQTTPLPSPSSSVAISPSPSSSPSSSPTPDPNPALYAQVEARLGGAMAQGLKSQQRLNASLERGRAKEQALSARVDAEAALISDLQDQISQLDDQISSTQDQVDSQRVQVAALARALYRRPNSWLVLVARAGSLHQALVESADLVVAGDRAHAVETRLQAQLDKLSADRAARQADLDRESATKDALDASLTQLGDALNAQQDVASQLLDILGQMQDALTGLRDQSPDAAAELATLLQQQQQSLLQASMDQAWARARVGSGRLQVRGLLPSAKAPKGLKLAYPEPGAPITQPFGPTDLALEPPLGPYPHFHSGVDFAEPEGTPILAAADGVVVAADLSPVGYGNHIVLAHAGGVETLYGHLFSFEVSVGDAVKQGQVIGREGSTGFSTGAHLHFELRIDGQLLDPMAYLPPAP